MKSFRRLRWALAMLAMIATALHAAPAWACSACFGDPQSNMARGAVWGVVVLGGVTYVLLMFVAGTGVFWYRRSRRLAQSQPIPGEE